MKKMFVMGIALGLLLTSVSAVMAGGDQKRGINGKGMTYENGCEFQPCFENAPKPGSSTGLNSSVSVQSSGLDSTEIKHLLFIREEEKLARDVYRVLYEKWRTPAFANIIESEQAHMDAMANLLNYYGIEDPVTSDEVGAFTDPAIDFLFDYLSRWGMQSERDALLVGGYIEEYDILDIWKAHAETDEDRIQRVYQNLFEGSYNHLDAFVHTYELLTGTKYLPQLLTSAQYDLVMAFLTQAKQVQGTRGKKSK